VAKNYDLKAVNPKAKSTEDTRTPEELLDFIVSLRQKERKLPNNCRLEGTIF
jgi:hypothetical protein